MDGMVKKLGIMVQAHMGSTRLPNKMMLQLCDKTVLGHVICRLQKVSNADALIVATSVLPLDDAIVAECERYHVSIYRGSDEDVLSRFYNAAVQYRLTDIARVCADNTLVDWEIIKDEITAYRTEQYPVVSPSVNVPLGLGCEIFSFTMLKDAYENGTEHYQREHVTPYIYENYGPVYHPAYEKDYRKYRFTLDTEEDWQLIQRIYHNLYHGDDNITLNQVIQAMDEHPEWFALNKNVHQKTVKE